MAKSKIQSLREQAKKLLEQAKREEEKAVADLGKNAVDYLKGTITKDELKSKAIDLGLIEE